MKKNNFLIVALAVFLLGCNDQKKAKETTVTKEVKKQKTNKPHYKKRGKQIALATKNALGKQLISKLNEAGALGALTYCNLKAIPITDSLANSNNAIVKRVSDKNRNPNNKANKKELFYINTFKEALKKGDKPKPLLNKTRDSVFFYAPIITNAMCLQCHGKPNKDISKETLLKIEALYPDDLATAYSENEIRGIWSIAFKKE